MTKLIMTIVSFLLNSVTGFQYTLSRKVILRQKNLCGKCNVTFSIMVPHEIHHLNHNCKDNTESNLLALCANCHSAHHRFGVPVYPQLPYHEINDTDKVYYDEFAYFKKKLDW